MVRSLLRPALCYCFRPLWGSFLFLSMVALVVTQKAIDVSAPFGDLFYFYKYKKSDIFYCQFASCNISFFTYSMATSVLIFPRRRSKIAGAKEPISSGHAAVI